MSEEIQIWGFVILIVSNIFGLAVAFYKFNEHLKADIDSKIKRVYDRMDVRVEEIERTFVRQDVHDIEIKNLEEKNTEKFNTTIRMFDLKLDNLTKAVNELISRMNGNK